MKIYFHLLALQETTHLFRLLVFVTLGIVVSSKPVAIRGNKRKQVDVAFNFMTTCFNEMQQEPKPTKNEHAVYRECVTNRIRKIKNPMRLCLVKNKIDILFFEAEMEE